jgi:hypothetical protein
MLAAGVLRPDAQQELLVGQLCGLLHQLQDYRGALTQHRSACSAYEVSRCSAVVVARVSSHVNRVC